MIVAVQDASVLIDCSKIEILDQVMEMEFQFR